MLYRRKYIYMFIYRFFKNSGKEFAICYIFIGMYRKIRYYIHRPHIMKMRLPALVIFGGLVIAISYVIAIAAIDAPHNDSNNVSCGSCHGQGLLNSPFWGGSMTYDQLCLNCHTASSGPYSDTNAPLVKTHSSENTSENHGIWSRECRNCHDPHYQKQKNYKSTDSGNLYLATGTITGCEDNLDGTSTLTYSSITYKSGWDATRVLEKTSEYRRAVLFPNVGKLGYSYPVIDIDEVNEEITVSGDATPVYQYISSSTFAMMYGQDIRNSVEGGQVKFFDRKGDNSYADGDTTYNGVCEVCHTQTMYHKNNGTGNYHYPASRCYVCHDHINAFAYDHGEPGKDCEDCHGHDDGWNGGSYYGTTQSHSTHTENDSDDLKGPYITCSDCHDTNNYPFFKSGTDGDGDGKYNLSETDVCYNCHSPNGAFDGVDDAVIGAKSNWENGVYASPTLKTGKEKWCAGCHDNQPAYSKPLPTEIIVDNLDPGAIFTGTWGASSSLPGYYGSNYHYHTTGSGTDTFTWTPTISTSGTYSVYARWTQDPSRAPDATYTIYHDGGTTPVSVDQRSNGGTWVFLGTFSFDGVGDKAELVQNANGYVIADAIKWESGEQATYAPNVIGDNATYGFYVTGHKINCLNCHDAARRHIDGEHGTYKVNEAPDPDVVVNPYCTSYRLKDTESGQCMIIPRPLRGAGANPLNTWQDFALCFSCHNKNEVLSQTGAPDATNFWNNDASPANSHNIHLGISSYHFDSDWDLVADSSESCTACHNIHGSPTKVMIRHGELISTPGTTDKIPALNFAYLVPYTPPYATATWTPSLAGGTYDVYAWWVESSNRASNAKYTVYYNGGSDEVTVNQQTNGGQWNLLGTYSFAAGTSGYVMLSNEGANGYVMADAIGWDNGSDGIPDVIIDNGDPEFSHVGDCLGNWTCASGISGAYDSDHCYHVNPGPQYDPGASLENSVGGRYSYAGQQLVLNKVCNACHGPISYLRTPTYIGPRVVMAQAEPNAVDNNGTDTVLFTAYVYSPDDTINSVTVDLTSIDSSATQTMYDDGTNGDVLAGDKIYSYQTTVPGIVGTGLKSLTVTGTDSQSRTGTRDIDLMVANPGWTVVDNWDADFNGYWTSSTSGDIYKKNITYHASGTGSDTATFTPVFTQAGNYNVYAWWTASANRATNAPYTINYSGGSDTVTVNQRVNGGEFVYLGTYHFNAQSGHTSVIVDNGDAVFAGIWGTSLYSMYYGTESRYIQSTATGSNTAAFTPDLPQAGNYDIYAWWTADASRATDVPYIITYSDGAGGTLTDTVRANQEQGGGGWTYLGTYYFDAGTAGNVEISDDAELNQYVIADAVKWQLSSTQQNVELSDDADGYVMADAILFEPE